MSKLLNSEIEKRVSVRLDRSINEGDGQASGIMRFGENNDYPQIIEKLIYGSQTAKATAKIMAKFIGGDGFTDPLLGSIQVGIDDKGKPITLDKIRRQSAQSLAIYNGVFGHANMNMNGEVGPSCILPFKNCRFSTMDAKGICGKVAVYDNWEKDKDKGNINKEEIQWFPVFNPKTVIANMKENGKKKFKGQIFFMFIDDTYLYPLSPFDSVFNDMDTEYQIQIFKNREIRNGFTDKIVMTVSEQEDEEAEAAMNKTIQKFMGPDGDKAIVMTAKFDDQGNLAKDEPFKIDVVKSNINPDLFNNVETSVSNNIRKAANGMPAILIDYQQGGLSQASGAMLIEATNVYNAYISEYRDALSEFLKEIYSNHPRLKEITDWSIKPVKLLDNGATNV